MAKIKKAGKVLKNSARKAVRKLSSATGDEKDAVAGLEKIAPNARRRAYRKNVSVTVIRRGKITKIFPGGREKVIGFLKKKLLKTVLPKVIRIR